MLIYLDNRQNVKGHPNENFAREIMELFSLGVGNYTEKDIKEAARAFTGWTFDNTGTRFMNRPESARRRREDVPRQDRQFQGRRHRRHHSAAACLLALHHAQALPLFRARRFLQGLRRQAGGEPGAEQVRYRALPGDRSSCPRISTARPPTATQIKSPVQLVVSTYKKLGVTMRPDLSRISPTSPAAWARRSSIRRT